jgi:hypothetical protein
MVWPFKKSEKNVSRQAEIENLKNAVSSERYQLYKNLVKLDDATKSIETEGVRGMLVEMFLRLEESKNRGK